MISLTKPPSQPAIREERDIGNLVFFAPIASYPARHGGAIRSLRLFEEIARKTRARSTLIGANFSLYIDGQARFFQDRPIRQRGRMEGAARSLVFRDHYLKAKQMNSSIVQEFLREVARLQPSVVLMSYLYSASLLPYLRNQRVFIDTHNNDWEWFENLRQATSNPLKRTICNNSLRHTNRYMEELSSHTGLIHVSNRDKKAYQKYRPDLRHLVVPNGCDVKPRKVRPNYETRPVRLLFVGSLSSKMNIDALEHFGKVYWPHLNGISQLTVAGSKPTKAVASLCSNWHWSLKSNVPDEELEDLYADAHYAILPFPYGCGSKLKLAEACARGLPVLSTGPGATGVETQLPVNVRVTDRPEEWAQAIRESQFTTELEKEGLKFAYLYSWELAASTLLDNVRMSLDKAGEASV